MRYYLQGSSLAAHSTVHPLPLPLHTPGVQNLNNQADAVMAAAGVPVIHTYDAVIAECGPAPQATCFGSKGCWCPHCSDEGYTWLAGIIAPLVRGMLTAAA